MKIIKHTLKLVLSIMLACAMASGPALADPPPWAGGNKGGRDKGDGRDNGYRSDYREDADSDHKDRDRRDGNKHNREGESVRLREYFGDRQRSAVNHYYDEQYRGGRCPPGLAKKHNGCMPPGQAKKWAIGRPLPHDVRYYEVPSSLVVQIGRPPSGYRYVRVATDILLIAVGSGMVVDAIQDLGRR